jgi:hypothetical protein
MLQTLLEATPPTAWAALAGVGGLVGIVGSRLLRVAAHRDASEHIVRLAKAVLDIEQTFETDLAQIAQTSLFARYPKECGEYSRRAHNALAAGEQLRHRPKHVLKAMLMLLHEDHRRLVELRMELDSALAVWATCQASLQRGAASARPPLTESPP